MPTATPTETHTALAATFLEKLEQAWNAADGAAFGALFADESDFVNVRGERRRGSAIGRGHQGTWTRSTPAAPFATGSSWGVSSPEGSSWPSRARPWTHRVGRCRASTTPASRW